MKTKIFAVLFIFLLGCQSPPKTESASSGPSQTDVVVDKTLPTSNSLVPGTKYVFNDKKATGSLPEEVIVKVKDSIRKTMNNLGYTESSARKAHLSIHLYSDHYSLLEKGTEGAAADLARFNITLFVNRFEKRPSHYSYFTLTSPNPDWKGYEESVLRLTEEHFPLLLTKAPTKDEKMKGDPGCMPRFGYEHDNGKVVEVLKGSAAEEAGIKLGDVIESVDSQSVDESLLNAEIYEKRLRVPVKLKRGAETIRTTLRAKITCG